MQEINFNSKKPPTQEQFNEYHKTPINYGEDGDMLLGHQYTKQEAIDLFIKEWVSQAGEKPDFDIAGSVIEGSAGWTVEPDQYEPNDFCFVMLMVPTKDMKVRYEAWRLYM